MKKVFTFFIIFVLTVNLSAWSQKCGKHFISSNTPIAFESQSSLNKEPSDDGRQPEKQYDRDFSPLDYGKGGIFEGRNPQDEEISLRSSTSKHFYNANGTLDAIITAGLPLNYKENGVWKTIRKEIITNNTGIYPEYTFANTSNTSKTFYPGNSNLGLLTEYDGSPVREWIDPSISWVVDGNLVDGINMTNSTGKVDLNKIVYSNCFPNTDVRFTQENAGKKLDIILRNAELLSNAPTGATHMAISETVMLPEGWSYRMTELPSATGGSIISVLNDKNDCVFVYAAPEYYDNNAGSGKNNGDYLVKQDGNKLEISTLIPLEWLTSGKRVFPVIIDPTATIYATTGGWQNSTSSYVDDVSYIFTGYYSSAVYRAWAYFNTSTVSDAATVSGVTLALYCDGGGSASATTIYTYSIDGGVYGPYGAYNVNYYNDFGAGTNYNSYSVSTLNATYGPTSLGSAAAGTLQGQLANDRFQIGLTNSNTTSETYWKRFTGSSYIVVTYVIAPACGNTSLGTIYPSTCSPQDAAYTSGTMPYWSFSAIAGYTYHFTLGANTEDSYLHYTMRV